MVNRSNVYEQFGKLFYAKNEIDNPPTVSYEELTDAEGQLGITFPKSYVQFVVEGPGACPMHKLDIEGYYSQLDEDEEDPSPWFVEDYFYNIEEMLEENIDSRWEDMPPDFIAIAQDHAGNSFGFDVNDSAGTDEEHRKEDMPVYFWDQDTDELMQVDPSFTHWIERHLALPSVKE